jgi:HEAT repeat protein
MDAVLEQLVSTRSQLSEGLMAYLRLVRDLPDTDALAFIGARRLPEIYIPPDVLNNERKGKGSQQRTDQAGTASPINEDQRQFSRDKDTRRRIPSERELRNVSRAVILGRPGEGKTLLAKMRARALAEASLRELNGRETDPRHVAIPVWVRLADVAQKGSVSAAVEITIRSWLGDSCHSKEGLPFIEALVRHVSAALPTKQCFLFLDALDEVTNRRELKSALGPLRNAETRVLVTSRPYGYDRSLLPFASVSEYELAPFTPRQRRQFVHNWFKHDTRCQANVLELVQGNPQFGDLTRNALLLTLTCATVERHELRPDETRRVDLYRFIVRDMVREVWKDDALADDDPHVSLMVRLLRHVVWALYRVNPARTLFPDDEWIDEIVRAAKGLGLRWDTQEVLDELRATGLLVSPALGKRMFLHRTFLEYLAAEHVAQQAEPLAHVEPFLWQPGGDGVRHWQPAAAEMICFLVGCLRDPDPLLQRLIQLDEEHQDHFRTMLLLAGRALADAPNARLSDGLSREITERVFKLFQHPPFRVDYWHFTPGLAHRQGLHTLVESMLDEEDAWQRRKGILSERLKATYALGSIGSERFIPVLIQQMQTHENEDIREASATALGRIGNERAIPAIAERLKTDESKTVREDCAEALGAIGGELASRELAEYLMFKSDAWGYTRHRTAKALGAIGDEVAASALIKLVDSKEDSYIRMQAVEALGQVESETAIRCLEKCLASKHLRRDALEALSNLTGERAAPYLIKSLRTDRDSWIRQKAAEALGAISNEEVIEALKRALQADTETSVRRAIIKSLRLVANADSLAPPLIRCAREDHDLEVRCMAISGLGPLTSATSALAALEDCLRPGEELEARVHAAAALEPTNAAKSRSILTKIGAERVVDIILARAELHNKEWLLSTAEALTRALGGGRVIPALVQRLEHDWRLNEMVVLWLGTIADKRALSVLIECLHDDPNERIRWDKIKRSEEEKSLDQMSMCGRGFAMSVCYHNDGIRVQAVKILGRTGGKRAMDALISEFLHNPGGDVAEALVETLAEVTNRTGQWIPPFNSHASLDSRL